MTNTAYPLNNKIEVVSAMQADIDAERLVGGGGYWNKETKVGCFIGCLVHDNDVRAVERLTGFSPMLTRIAESVFEGLFSQDIEAASKFAIDILEAPKQGANLDLAPWLFLLDTVERAVNSADDETKKACEPALEVLRKKSRGESVSIEEARAAYARAADAADADAYARAADAAAYAAAAVADAYAAADAAAYAVADAYAAADAAAYAVARAAGAERKLQAATLIKILSEA